MTHPAQNAPTALTISEISIRQDEQGRYCLNDLHRASGGENRHRPSLWLKNRQTVELMKELKKAGIPAFSSRQKIGSFVHQDLVYDYAMWISPAFKVKVIRAYDAIATQARPNPAPEALPTPVQAAINRRAFIVIAEAHRQINLTLTESARRHLAEGHTAAETADLVEHGPLRQIRLVHCDELRPLAALLSELSGAVAALIEGQPAP
ncbi:KilA-N domain-containing protein [Methylomagnum ishizawai]|uniref:KilA-N domain-containing protein n=1 Tax=Methylomagnum ishizawai TaxID=1760988 RepID=A0A1Y6D576_9GAMM|nr:KilA-N domain-containing protein [Methylomagnum ishizawai]SMF97756.1 KilA-N domain-containing protein [Methylomagnum ishizawai]